MPSTPQPAAPAPLFNLEALLNTTHPASWSGAPPTASQVAGLVRQLKVSRAPYLVLPGFWERSRVDTLRDEVVSAMRRCHISGEGGDNRTMGVDLVAANGAAPYLKQYVSDPVILKAAAAYFNRNVSRRTQAGFVVPGASSGGGWHVDSTSRGFKAMLYLDDVHEGNGPFAMLLGYNPGNISHNRDYPRGRRTRYDEDAVRDRVRWRQARIHKVMGPKGTLVLFETHNIHRGMPALRAPRLSLTTYFHSRAAMCRNPKNG